MNIRLPAQWGPIPEQPGQVRDRLFLGDLDGARVGNILSYSRTVEQTGNTKTLFCLSIIGIAEKKPSTTMEDRKKSKKIEETTEIKRKSYAFQSLYQCLRL